MFSVKTALLSLFACVRVCMCSCVLTCMHAKVFAMVLRKRNQSSPVKDCRGKSLLPSGRQIEEPHVPLQLMTLQAWPCMRACLRA
jgi:hypothetical protein